MGRAVGTLLVVLALLCSCGWFGREGTVEVLAGDGYVIIDNGLSIEIYYALGERSFMSFDRWMPSFEHPSLDAGKRKSIPYANVPNGKDTGVQAGDVVDVYWWDNGYRGDDGLHMESVVIR